ncbi:MAG: hypothetical protein EPO11_04520, partial [Gammaproteobacteria bacterium]
MSAFIEKINTAIEKTFSIATNGFYEARIISGFNALKAKEEEKNSASAQAKNKLISTIVNTTTRGGVEVKTLKLTSKRTSGKEAYYNWIDILFNQANHYASALKQKSGLFS